MDITISVHVGVWGVDFVVGVEVGVGVDGMIVTMIVSKIGIGILHRGQDVAALEARKDSTGIGHYHIVRLRELQQAEM